ncbi:hypothetical protein BX666DRAFT_2032275 [Dichotomocladium elegans]|nr:hypothetical protein BX666DRAFT_2032275 [Dichotomocladium elegans]
MASVPAGEVPADIFTDTERAVNTDDATNPTDTYFTFATANPESSESDPDATRGTPEPTITTADTTATWPLEESATIIPPDNSADAVPSSSNNPQLVLATSTSPTPSSVETNDEEGASPLPETVTQASAAETTTSDLVITVSEPVSRTYGTTIVYVTPSEEIASISIENTMTPSSLALPSAAVSSSSSPTTSTGAIIGGVVGGVAGVALIVGLAVLWFMRQCKAKREPKEEKERDVFVYSSGYETDASNPRWFPKTAVEHNRCVSPRAFVAPGTFFGGQDSEKYYLPPDPPSHGPWVMNQYSTTGGYYPFTEDRSTMSGGPVGSDHYTTASASTTTAAAVPVPRPSFWPVSPSHCSDSMLPTTQYNGGDDDEINRAHDHGYDYTDYMTDASGNRERRI